MEVEAVDDHVHVHFSCSHLLIHASHAAVNTEGMPGIPLTLKQAISFHYWNDKCMYFMWNNRVRPPAQHPVSSLDAGL